MDTLPDTTDNEHQRLRFVALAVKYREKARNTSYRDLEGTYTRLASGYESLATSFAKLDQFSEEHSDNLSAKRRRITAP